MIQTGKIQKEKVASLDDLTLCSKVQKTATSFGGLDHGRGCHPPENMEGQSDHPNGRQTRHNRESTILLQVPTSFLMCLLEFRD